MAVYLSEIIYHLGETKAVDNLQAKPEIIKQFKVRGLQFYSESITSEAKMLSKTVAKLRSNRFGIETESLDHVIFVSDNRGCFGSESFAEQDLNALLVELGCPRALFSIVSTLSCSSLSMAVHIAEQMIQGQTAENILVVYLNKLRKDGQRFTSQPVYVLSDGTLAFFISSKQPQKGYRLLRSCQNNDVRLQEKMMEEGGYLDFLELQLERLRELLDGMLMALDTEMAGIKRLYFNNFMPHLVKMFYDELGVSVDQQFLDNIPRFSHLYSADTFINLADDKLESGDRTLLLPNSITRWGGLVLEKL